MSTIYDSVDELKEMLFGKQTMGYDEVIKKINNDVKSGRVSMPPQYLMMKVTNLCNSDCIYCNHAKSRTQYEKKEKISLEQVLSIIDQAAELGVKAISISGGEPLVRNDIEVMIERIVSHKIVPVLLTNGVFLKERAESLYKHGLRYFIVSIDSLNEDEYLYQRGIKIDPVLEGVKILQNLREKDPSLKIHITPVITAKNILHMPEMVESFSKKQISLQFSPYHVFTYLREDPLATFKKNEVEEIIERLIKMKQQGYLIANSEAFLKHFKPFMCDRQIVPKGYNCLAGYSTIYVDTYENVLPCWNGGLGAIGNLKEKSLSQIWYSEQYQRCRNKMKACQCPGCWLLCTGELTIMTEGRE